MFFVVLCRNFN